MKTIHTIHTIQTKTAFPIFQKYSKKTISFVKNSKYNFTNAILNSCAVLEPCENMKKRERVICWGREP